MNTNEAGLKAGRDGLGMTRLKPPFRIAGTGGWIKDANKRTILRLYGNEAESDLDDEDLAELVQILNLAPKMYSVLSELIRVASLAKSEEEFGELVSEQILSRATEIVKEVGGEAQ